MNDNEVISKYYKLKSCRAVAELYGCSVETIRRVLKKHNIALTGWKSKKVTVSDRRCAKLTQEEKEHIKNVYMDVGNQRIVADITKHSSSTIGKVLKEYGLNKGRGGNQEKQIKVTDNELFKACKTMTSKQIAEKYCMHEQSLPRRYRKLGIYPIGYGENNGCLGKYNQNLKSKAPIFGLSWHYVKSHDDYYTDKYKEFAYLESRNTKNNGYIIRLKCKKCGAVIERRKTTRYKSIKCNHCEEQQKIENGLINERIRLIRFFNALEESKTPKICKHCGATFYSEFKTAAFCSRKCRYANRRHTKGNYRKRCRKFNVLFDPSVTRIKVFKKDKYICQICGKTCDKTDHRYGFIGPDSPTLDHIVALANGGTHTWDNVQCACFACNSRKRDLIRYSPEVS